MSVHLRNMGLIAALLAVQVVGCAAPRTETKTKRPSDDRPRAAPNPPIPALPPSSHALTGTSNDDTYTIVCLPTPAPIPLNELFSLDVRVFEGSDRARLASDIALSVDAAMPQHLHGMNTRPKVVRGGPGRFIVTGMLFHMSGHWELYFDITRAGVTERAQFNVDLE